MKRALLVLTVSVFIFGVTNKTNAQSKFSYGAKLGLNYEILTTKYVSNKPSTTDPNPKGLGFHLGGYANYNFTDKLGARAELLFNYYATKTSSTETNDYPTESTVSKSDDKTRFSYISIPLLVNFSADKNISFQSGFQVGFLAGFKHTYTGTTTTTYKATSFSAASTETHSYGGTSTNKTSLNVIDAAFAIGGIYEMDNGLNFGLRYNRSLNSLNTQLKSFFKEHWNVIQISVGYKIGGKK